MNNTEKSTQPFLAFRNASKSYGTLNGSVSVIRELTFEFPVGNSFAILGPSGVGKSTLLHLIGALDSLSDGEIEIQSQQLSQLSERELTEFRRRSMGFIFQFHHLLPEFSALENVAMPLVIDGLSKPDALSEAEVLLKRFELGHRLEHRPSQLSGGEQQRVAIARAMIHKPDFVLADEPTGNLDEGTAEVVTQVLLEMARESEARLIIVTHSRQLAGLMECQIEMSQGGSLSVVSTAG